MGSILLTQIVGTLFLGCLMATMMLVPGVMRFAQWIGAVDRGGYRKVFQGQMPLLGGLGIAIPLIFLGIGSSLAGTLIVRYWPTVQEQFPDHWGLFMSFSRSRTDFLMLALGGMGQGQHRFLQHCH